MLAKHLNEFYPHCHRGARYLLQLAGDVAMDRPKPPSLEWILNGASPHILRGIPSLNEPSPQAVHKLKVQFHRHF